MTWSSQITRKTLHWNNSSSTIIKIRIKTMPRIGPIINSSLILCKMFFFKFFIFFTQVRTMKSIFVWACLLTALFQPGVSDIYLHCPPGSNNRLSGEGAAVTNANRLFDSQVGGTALFILKMLRISWSDFLSLTLRAEGHSYSNRQFMYGFAGLPLPLMPCNSST